MRHHLGKGVCTRDTLLLGKGTKGLLLSYSRGAMAPAGSKRLILALNRS